MRQHKRWQEPYRVIFKMRLENLPEMEKLLMKYSNGSVPPLIAEDGKDGRGLLSEELLDIFKKGFSATYSIPLCVAIVQTDRPHPEQPSAQRKDLLPPCRHLRSIRDDDEEMPIEQRKQVSDSTSGKLSPGCCECSTANLELIAQSGKTGAYMCCVGMVGPTVPIYVADEIVAVLSSEFKKPRAGVVWPESLGVQSNCNSSSFGETSTKIEADLWQESKRRIQKCEEILDIEPDRLLRAITEEAKADPDKEVSPEILETMMNVLESAGAHLTEMAGKTYRLEKDSVTGWLRAEMASALSSVDTFWNNIQQCFGHLARLVGADYILLIARDGSSASPLNLQCQYGLPAESLPVLEYDWTGSTARVDDFVKEISVFERGVEIDLRKYRDVPILGMLYSLYGKGVSYPVFIVPTTTLNSGLTLMVLGKGDINSALSTTKWLREDDRQYLTTIVREMAIVTSVFSSMKRIQETVEEQTNLMESVAHDLRTPIQNIMIAAENLREGRGDPERASRTITGVVTQLQRLNLLAQKTWALEQIRLDKLVYNDKQMVDPYLVFVECKELLTDMAERAFIEIYIDPDTERWRAVQLDMEMFRLLVLNLLHNGIKYSFPNTSVKIGGWQNDVGAGMSITFENEGIRIHDEEKDRIFERYFRSKDAIRMDPAGSGIGLALVKEFVDHYDGKIDVRSTEVGFGKYSNVFSLFLPGR